MNMTTSRRQVAIEDSSFLEVIIHTCLSFTRSMNPENFTLIVGTPPTSSNHQGWRRLQNRPHRPWQIEGRPRTIYQLMDAIGQLLVLPAKSSVHSSILRGRRADDSGLISRLAERVHLQTSAAGQVRKRV